MSNKFKPTAEQIACVEAAKNTQDNLLIEALAGAAKSSTLELIARALPGKQMLFLAFNKKIADELKERMPSNCTCMTLNSLGHRAWGEVVGRRLTLYTDKCATILRDLINEFPKKEQSDLWESFPDILRACSHAKGAGHVPDSIADIRPCSPLMNDQDLIDSLDEMLSPLERQLLIATLERSMQDAFEGKIDYNDQLLMPTVFRASFPMYPLVLVDETQDLSELNHVMLSKLAKKRIIAVGDQFQAIYAFRGAHEEGMGKMRERFNMTTLSLTTTFRCPPAIVEHVRWRAPNIQAWEGHPFPGEVIHAGPWSLDDLPDDAAVICRNNAPLFGLAVKLLKSGRYPNLWGNDIGAGLLKVMEKFGPTSMSQSAALSQLRDWKEAQLRRVKNKKNLEDRAECIQVFLEAASDLGGAINYAQTIFRSKGRVHLMTGHKSKGHEFEEVFFLEEKALRDEGQDLNLRYVICTRAQKSLRYINVADFILEE
jgi:superfamily I DNA/RNA helicase